MKPPIELDDENAAPPINALPSSYSLPSLSPLNTSVHVVKSTPFPVEITVEEVSIQGTHVASLSVSTPTTDESQKIKMTSTNSTATPDPRWPSKCRWSMESPPPVSTGTVSIEGKISGPEMSSKPTVVSNCIEDMRHQIDVNDLESTLKDSSETEYIMGVSDSGVEPELEAQTHNLLQLKLILWKKFHPLLLSSRPTRFHRTIHWSLYTLLHMAILLGRGKRGRRGRGNYPPSS
ncbi:unnamed protein product [Brassica oleracea]